MKIIPFEKLTDIPTGNPYKGNDGLVDLGPDNSTMDIAELFPFHTISVGWRPAADNITSHILEGQVRIGYDANNILKEIEILSPRKKTHIKCLKLGNCSLFQKTMLQIKNMLEIDGFQLTSTNGGFDLYDGSVAFYSEEYVDDMNVPLDTVVLRFL